MGISIDVIVRDEDVLARIREAQTVVIPSNLEASVSEILSDAADRLEQYPPETAANQPPPPYYERGVGYFGRYSGGQVTPGKESQQLGSHWIIETTFRGGDVEGTLSNAVTYSGYVHDDSPHTPQTPFHARTGWPIAVNVIRGIASGTGDEATTVDVETSGPIKRAVDRIVDFFKR